MQHRTRKRGLIPGAAAMLAILVVAAGCGGGAGSRNEDDGYYVDGRGNKTITRTLDNQSDMGVEVVLEVNGVDYLDTIFIPADDWVNVTIERMREPDEVWYDARFSNGSRTSGRFGEDGRTIFTHRSSRATAAESAHENGKSAVKTGGRKITLDASKAQRTPP